MKAIENRDGLFVLHTRDTTYAFRIMDKWGCAEHLYYGRKIHIASPDGLTEHHCFAPGNTICYSEELNELSLEDACLEFGNCGKGDIREPLIEAVMPDGSRTLDFRFMDFSMQEGTVQPEELPGAYDDMGLAETLVLQFADAYCGLALSVYYTVFPDCNVITRRAVIKNASSGNIRLERCLSMSLDFPDSGYVMTTFNGAWAREMARTDTRVTAGKFVNASFAGTSSNRANPFIMLSKSGTDENSGLCYGFNLIYSGNHYAAAEVNSYGKTRFVQGINPQNFSFLLEPGKSFETPEAVMTCAYSGFNALSRNMHDFVREHIVRGKWKYKERPVLLNSWEAAYFKISRSGLLRLAKAGKEAGIELFVMDDGWFAKRDDDGHSLGDWEVNEKKIPGGLGELAKSITELGMGFGIWVEPEMVNVDSELYRAHPEWAVDIPGRAHSEGRNQRILDLTRGEVQDYIIEAMIRVFSSGDISYVKWDMNRIFSDFYSKALPPERMGEMSHRYVLGLYRCMEELTKRFPDILFEGCASGGNRFDLGILCYFPQIWASDNTDAICRAEIQNNYSYGYPQSVISAHVSGVPNHQTLRRTPMDTRGNVASFGVLGYECNLCDMSAEDRKQIAEQIREYKEHRKLYQFGNFYRGRSFSIGAGTGSVLTGDEGNLTEWTVVSKNKREAVGLLIQKLVHPNTQYHCYRACGLAEDMIYRVHNEEKKINIKDYGDLINTAAPVHIKQDSAVHNLASKFVKLDGAVFDYSMYGDELMYAGVKLNQAFSGTGLSANVRHFPDFASIKIYMSGEDYDESV